MDASFCVAKKAASVLPNHSGQSGSGFSGRVCAKILKNFRASIGPDAGAKSRFSVNDRAFEIAGIKQREHVVKHCCSSLE